LDVAWEVEGTDEFAADNLYDEYLKELEREGLI
jgi:hypothetical protein